MQDDMDVQQSLATITPSLLHLNKYANHPDLPPNWVEGKRCCPKDCVVQLCFHHTKVVMRIFRLLHPLANAVNSKSLRTSAGGPVPQKSAPSINTNSNMMVAKLKLKVKDLGKQKLATRKGDFHSALIHLAPHM